MSGDYVKFQFDPTVGLRIMTVAVKLDRCTSYVKNPNLTFPESYHYMSGCVVIIYSDSKLK
jgi:hypothetical protein